MIDDLRHYSARHPSGLDTALQFAFRLLALAAILLALAVIVSQNEAHAGLATTCKRAGTWAMLLPDAYRAADGDECRAAFPSLPRPIFTASLQNGTGTQWHYRTCFYGLTVS